LRHPLDEAELIAPEPQEDLLALDESLKLLATTDRTAADLVQLRYFGGLTVADAAQVLGLSFRSAERIWTHTRVWLLEHINNPGQRDDPS
jgi:DNA-directed RNA polymerase specialized sigma24 family protein